MTVLPHATKKTSSSVARGEITITYRPDKKVCAQPKPNTKTIARRLLSPVRPNTRRKASPSPSASQRKKEKSDRSSIRQSPIPPYPKGQKERFERPTHPATHTHQTQTLCFTGVPARPDCCATCRIARACQKGNGLPFRNSTTSGQFRRLESTGRVVHLRFTVHTRGGGGRGGGAGDEGSGVNHRISRSRSGRAGERAPASLFSARECFLAPWFSKLSVL